MNSQQNDINYKEYSTAGSKKAEHKKSKSHMNQVLMQGDTISGGRQPYVNSVHSRLESQLRCLENSFVKNSVNQSYERIHKDTIDNGKINNRTLQLKRGIPSHH